MRLLTTDALFPWNKLPDSPGLAVLRQLLDLLPDAALLAALRNHRGHGRNDIPVHVLWRVHMARYILRHVTMEACLGELERNPALRQAVGIEAGMKIPEPWNMSRFQEVLGRKEHLAILEAMFGQLTGTLAGAVEDLGVNLAGDSAALSARNGRNPEAELGLPLADGAKKQYLDEQGKVVKTYEWFGYKFHLLVDVKHEVIVAFEVTTASCADVRVIPRLLAKAEQALPEGRVRTLAYDKAADSQEIHQLLKRHDIKPLIEIRAQWKEQSEQRLPGHDKGGNVVHDEAGTIFCYDLVSAIPNKRKMSYIGFEKSRGTLKYRCPARHEGIPCPSEARCNGKNAYGKTVRVKCELDLRRFPPIPRATAEFEKRYDGRTAVERVNGRVKLFWGADDGNVSGAARFHAHLYSIMLVHAGFASVLASAPRFEGQSLSPTRLHEVARRLRQAALPQ